MSVGRNMILAAGILAAAGGIGLVIAIRAYVGGFLSEIRRKAALDERRRAAWRAAGEGRRDGRPGGSDGKAGKFDGNGNGGAA